MFSYCGNNPINRIDRKGLFWKSIADNFSQTLKSLGGYFAVAAGVSQVDSPIPGPADLVSLAMFAAGLIACVGITAYTAVTAPTPTISIPNYDIKEKALEDIAVRRGIGECVEAAREMKKANNNRGYIVNLYFPNAHNGYVCCDRYPQAISENGNHYGYLYEGIVRCNIYPEGLPLPNWINSFYDASGTPPIVTYF